MPICVSASGVATPSTRSGGLFDWKIAIASAVNLSYFWVSVPWYRPSAASVNCKQATLDPVDPMANPASLWHHATSGTSARTTAGADVVAAPTLATSIVAANNTTVHRHNLTHVFCRE